MVVRRFAFGKESEGTDTVHRSQRRDRVSVGIAIYSAWLRAKKKKEEQEEKEKTMNPDCGSDSSGTRVGRPSSLRPPHVRRL